MEFCESVCLTACFQATGGLRFYSFKMNVWSTLGSALVLPYILLSDTCTLKMYAIFACQKYFLFVYKD